MQFSFRTLCPLLSTGSTPIGHKTFGQNRRPKQGRRASPDQLAAALSAVQRQHAALPPDSPRRRPTLAILKFLLRADDAGGDA
jgi:hypothetical protein